MASRKRSAKEAQLSQLLSDYSGSSKRPAAPVSAEDDTGELLGAGSSGGSALSSHSHATGPVRAPVLAASASAPSSVTAMPPVASRLLRALFQGTPAPTLASRLSRALPLDVYRPPALTPTELLAKANEKRARAMRRNAARAAKAALQAAAPRQQPQQLAAPPSGSLLGLALALSSTKATAAAAAAAAQPPPQPTPPAQQLRRPIPAHRRAHGWCTDASVAAAAAAHWHSSAYALTCRAAISRRTAGGSAGGTAAGPAAVTLAGINRAELEAARARKGWVDPSLSAREHRAALAAGGAAGAKGSGAGAVAAAAASSALPSTLPIGPAELTPLLCAKEWALVRQAKWVGAQVAVAEGGGGGSREGSSGTIVWVGRAYFTLRSKAGAFATLRKAGSLLLLQWPARLAPGGPGIEVRVPATALTEARAWDK